MLPFSDETDACCAALRACQLIAAHHATGESSVQPRHDIVEMLSAIRDKDGNPSLLCKNVARAILSAGRGMPVKEVSVEEGWKD